MKLPLDLLHDISIFNVQPIYIGDADEGTEGICGHTRMYKHDGYVYITQDDNQEGKEILIAQMTVDFYNDNF